jgi:hypothetical protein
MSLRTALICISSEVIAFCTACSAGSERFANGVEYAGLRTELERTGVMAEGLLDRGLDDGVEVAALMVCARVLGT